jgi:outer membrane protein
MINISKAFIAFCSALVLFMGVGATSAQAELKIGVVDIDKVFNEYYKTRAAEDRLNEARDAARKEVDARWATRIPMLEAIAAFNRDLDNKSLPAPVRADKTKRRDEVFAKMQNLEREVEQLNYSRETAIREEASKSRAIIVEEIMKLVNERVKADGLDLVIDKSGRNASGVLALLASKPEMEFSDDLITALNKTKPTATPPPAKPAATKPAPKK